MVPHYFPECSMQYRAIQINNPYSRSRFCHLSNFHFIILRGNIFSLVIDTHIILVLHIYERTFLYLIAIKHGASSFHSSSFCVSCFELSFFRSESFIAMNGNEVVEDEKMVEEEDSTEKMVFMWGYLPGASSEKAPILSPTQVRLTDPLLVGDSWKDVCGGGCGFAVAISG